VNFDVGVLTNSEIEEEAIRGQIQGYGDGKTGLPPAIVHVPFGFYSKPIDPWVGANGEVDTQQGCQSLYAFRGDQMHIIPSFDPRTLKILPTIHKGDSLQYGADGSFIRIDNERHTISAQTTFDGTPDGPTIFWSLGPDGFIVHAPWGKLEFSPNGFIVSLSNGARIDLGGIGGLASVIPPLAKILSYATIKAGSVHVEGSQTLLGSSPTDTYLPAGHGSPTDIGPNAKPFVKMLSPTVKIAAAF